MRTRLPLLLLVLAAAALAGCSKKSPTSPTSTGSTPGDPQAQVMRVIAGDPQAIEDGLFDSAMQTPTAADPALAAGDLAAGPFNTTTAIQPLRFWRTITQRTRSFEIFFSDTDQTTMQPTTAEVHIHKTLIGTFNILTGMPTTNLLPADSALMVVHKPLEDHWERRVMLKRVANPPVISGATDEHDEDDDDGRPRWRIAAISGVDVTSQGATTKIKHLEIQTAAMDTTIDDPLEFHRVRNILHFSPGDTVTLIVTTERNDDVVVLQSPDRRVRFRNNGNNTYTGRLRLGIFAAGIHHFGVNALSHGTLYDDQMPYDSEAWVFPYAVWPECLTQYIP